jgi:hypothetical protein
MSTAMETTPLNPRGVQEHGRLSRARGTTPLNPRGVQEHAK